MGDTQDLPQIGYILRSYPRLSQTFILNEILALERLGLQLQIFAITNPAEPLVQAQVAEVRAPVTYLEHAGRRGMLAALAEHLGCAIRSPRRYAQTLAYALLRRDLDAGYSNSSRLTCFAQAVYLAGLMARSRRAGQPIDHLHAHFAHDPTTVALLASMLTGCSFSFTGHARDLYQIPRSTLATRIEEASTVITCCGANLGYLHDLTPGARGKMHLIHHGVDLRGFTPAPAVPNLERPPLILSVGRLVEKKGFPDLLHACALLKRSGRRFRCLICGEGPLRGELQDLLTQLDLADSVELVGERLQRELLPLYQQAAIFALAPFVTDDGDRDGVPNVLVEAMACGVPVVSTAVAGIPELVEHAANGLLVASHEPAVLAAALGALLDDPARRQALGAAGRRAVVAGFDLDAAARRIAALLDPSLFPLTLSPAAEKDGAEEGTAPDSGHRTLILPVPEREKV